MSLSARRPRSRPSRTVRLRVTLCSPWTASRRRSTGESGLVVARADDTFLASRPGECRASSPQHRRHARLRRPRQQRELVCSFRRRLYATLNCPLLTALTTQQLGSDHQVHQRPALGVPAQGAYGHARQAHPRHAHPRRALLHCADGSHAQGHRHCRHEKAVRGGQCRARHRQERQPDTRGARGVQAEGASTRRTRTRCLSVC